MTPTVSVVMNCLNCATYVREAIESVYAQTYTDWEIVFWDNASTDVSGEIARSFDDGKLRYFRGAETVPLGQARNLALEQAQGQYIAFLDCDDLWLPTKLEKQIPLFDDAEVGLVYCDVFSFNSRGKELRLYAVRPSYEGHCFRALLVDFFLWGVTVIIRRSTLATLDAWFDGRFNMIAEADLFRRIGYRWKLAMVNEPLARWRVHQGSSSWSRQNFGATETDQMLDKYGDLFEGFFDLYEEEVASLRRKSARTVLHLIWNGDRQEARRMLRPRLANPRALAIYVSTFLPRPLFRRLYELRGKAILPS